MKFTSRFYPLYIFLGIAALAIICLFPSISAAQISFQTTNDNYWDSSWNAGQNGTLTDVTVFSGGNVSSSYTGANTSFASMVGGTAHYSNGDGTYNTITVASSGGGYSSNGCGGGGNDSNGTPQSISSGGCDSGGSYNPVCPSGYTLFNNSSCCPNAYYSTVDTNGDAKGGVEGRCNPPPQPPYAQGSYTPAVYAQGSYTTACSVNGTAVPHGSSYTFYTTESVPYRSTCTPVPRTCVNGVFSGSNSTYSRCTVDEAPPIGNITIKAVPPIVRYGESSTIIWDGANSEVCTVKGYALDAATITGESLVENVTGESTYTLHCTLGPNSKSTTTTLKILPRTQET